LAILFKRPTSQEVSAPQAPESHPALDTAAAFLRSLGESAVEIPGLPASEVTRQSDAWALHLLVGSAAPTQSQGGDEHGASHFSGRDWTGARRFVGDVLRRQAGRVQQSFGDLREALSACLRGMSDAVAGDAVHDDQVHQHLDRMRAAVESGQADLIRREVSRAIEGISGALQVRRERNQRRTTELSARVRALNDELFEARKASETDSLTRLANRRAFDAALEQALAPSRGPGGGLLLLLDLDRFKEINDRCGHGVGDQVLKRVADKLARAFLRRSDLVARWGGEEFAVLLLDTGDAHAAAVGTRALEAVRSVMLYDLQPGLTITASIGIAAANPNEGPAAWVQRADEALYEAKKAGRDRAVLGR